MKLGIVWDLDGTLLDTLEDLMDAVNYTMEQFGCPERSLEEIRSFVGTGARNLVLLSLPEEKKELIDLALPVYQKYYNAHSQVKTRPYPGIPEALAEISRMYPVAIASNKPDSAVKPLCREYFGDFFALGETTDCPRKPAPDMVYKAMAAIGVETCIYVGDSEVDIATARNAGVPCLSVLWGFRDRNVLEAAGGKHFCGDPRQLCETVKLMAENII